MLSNPGPMLIYILSCYTALGLVANNLAVLLCSQPHWVPASILIPNAIMLIALSVTCTGVRHKWNCRTLMIILIICAIPVGIAQIYSWVCFRELNIEMRDAPITFVYVGIMGLTAHADYSFFTIIATLYALHELGLDEKGSMADTLSDIDHSDAETGDGRMTYGSTEYSY